MRILIASHRPETGNEELYIKIDESAMEDLGINTNISAWLVINKKDFPYHSFNGQMENRKKFRTNRSLGYPILTGKPPKIDLSAEYYIKCYAPACGGRPVIVRCDGLTYEENDSWIVDNHNLIEVKST
ncbi:hypothetical protein M655_009370 [Brevibacillus sp. NSP2.1]|uniref:hypothetical protein n=1 Tax=Brevibacillus sp. NSP2.1 TaxID=3003229 RepID=UPI00047C1553|nr:hypothetical protein [Brevibacillus sp. NSP2.1]QHZ55835.1 hypothetical protein M655_009370 [Brevibacillus sp. NSP2.1]